MLTRELPREIDYNLLLKLAKEGEVNFQGTLKIDKPNDLDGLIGGETLEIQASLTYGHDEVEAVPLFEGQWRSVIKTTCQRCLDELTLTLENRCTIHPYLTGSNLEIHKHKSYELFEITEGIIDIQRLLIEEVLLALPIVPKHENDNCQPMLSPESGQEKKKDNPFEQLKAFIK